MKKLDFILSSDLRERAEALLVSSGLLHSDQAGRALSSPSTRQLYGDGSSRRFLRISDCKTPLCILVIPGGDEKDDLAEARSAWLIGNHLRRNNVPVPELYGWDETTGMLLFEDLGDTRLHDIVTSGIDKQRLLASYINVVETLSEMQVAAGVDFDESWCWDSPRYDRKLMLKRESGYFLSAFWQGLLGRETVPGVWLELEDIAARVNLNETDYFLHRDFQCRNIMIKDGQIRFIDFQGGRTGPPGYDLASLLIDPYAALSPEMRSQLLDHYIISLTRHITLDRDHFIKQYSLLAFQRNMQIVGAFSFLYQIKKKTFFADYISPALHSLGECVQQKQFSQYSILKKMVNEGITLWERNKRS